MSDQRIKRERILSEPDLEILRDEHGVPHVRAADEQRLYRGLGYCHAHDRGLQMLLMRVLGQGRLAEQLDGSDAGVQTDRFFRRMNWSGDTGAEVARLSPEARALVDAYCEGVNARFARKVPWELRLAGYRHEPWRPEDSILLARMTGYLTLAQSQGELERLIVEMVQAGVDRARLEELFPGKLGELDLELLGKVTLGERLVPAELRWSAGARLMASNNWVVAGRHTASGKPILANDPHLEANRLPNVWYEVVLTAGERWGMGATMPGLPALLLGRTPELAWGATYTFADTVDSWVEQCRDGKRLREGQWAPLRQRREVIRRKKGPAVEVTFHESEHGVLDGDPAVEGHYLSTRWSAAATGARSLEALLEMWRATSVAEGMELLGRLEPSFNWVLADRAGAIGYQMSGLVPRRRPGASGLVPLPGWEARNDWGGFHDGAELPRLLDPASGFIVTANNDLNHHGRVAPISVSMGPYRAERIAALLAARPGLTVEDMGRIQQDLFSLQAERLMAVLEPLLPEGPQAEALRRWDRRYDVASVGATLFERVYRGLQRAVFGDAAVAHLLGETGVFADFHAAFDQVLLAERSAWFGEELRDALYRRVLAETLDGARAGGEVPPWGEGQQIVLSHLLFGGKLPRLLGFDRGPITLPGGRATPQQGQIYRSAGRTTSFVPSFRMITDLAKPELHTALLGGPSDRRWSRWYCSELSRWLAGTYKVLRP